MRGRGTEFFDEFAERPFIIIGARLSEEFDLAELLNSGTAAERQTGFPSVVVTPTLTALRKQELFALGLTVIESDGETFVRTLLEHYRTAMQSLSGEYGGAISPELAKFLQQFIDLRSYDPSGVQTTRDFYAGYEPTWGTIAADDDAILQLSEQVATAVGAAAVADEVTQQVYFLSGRPGTGKSTILLRVAQTLIGLGVRPFLFRADEGIDVEAVVHWLRTVPRTVLLFDDCADFARAIQRLSETCREENVRLLAFGTERTGRIRAIRDAISSTFLRPDPPYVSGRLSDSDIGTLLDKLNSRGRLGHITRFSPDRQRSYFMQTAGRRLFEGMAGLEGGLGFNLKVRRDYDNLSSDSGRVAYAAACIAYELGVALPPGTACEVAGMRTRELVAFVEADGADLLELTRGGLRPPHRITASLLVRLLPRPVRFSITLSTIKALARHVDRQAISSMTRPYRLVRQLMDQETVVRHVGRERASEWYDQIREEYSWNSRYWEQRALLESRLGDHTAARSYAERALRIQAHPFTFNTLGTVLMRIAIDRNDVQTLLAAIENLERARKTPNWEASEHPYVRFFTSIIRFGQTWGLDSIPQRVRSTWTSWFREASSTPAFSHAGGRSLLRGWQRQWLELAS